MASKKLKVSVNLDFTSDQMSIDKIREQIDAAVSAVKINLDPESAKKFEAELRELGGMLERHLNQNTGKINAKSLVADLDNRENFLMIEKLGQRYAEVGVNGQQSFRKIANEADFLNKKISVSNKTLEKMGTTLMNTIRWNISSTVVNAVTSEFQRMYYFAKDLDRTLTDIRIVSGQSANQMERFALAANESAKALGVSTIEYAQAATLFFQQGLGEVDVRNMTDGAVMASRITGVAASDMADLLTSTMNGYRLAADEVINVTDKLAAVGATTAADFNELATGMSKVASMANTAGISIDELNAQIATIVSVTRESPESIGTSLKTIYGRMLMFKTDTKALMEDEDGEVFGAPKVEEALQAYNRVAGAQISLFQTAADGRRELRDLGEVIEEIGNSWDTVTDKTAKFGLATALAGSRQQNRLVALFDSWDMYKDAVETSLNAEGTTLRQNAIYLESYEGKLKGLQAAKEEMYMVLTDSDSMKFFIGALTEGVQLFTKLADMAGGFSAVLGIIGVAFSDNLVKKAYEFQQAFVLPKEMKETGKDNEQIQSLKELHAISKVFGEDEANRYREDLRNKKAALKEMKRESQLLIEKATLLEDIAEVAEVGDNEAKKKAVVDSLISEATARGVAVESAEELRDKYNELAKAQENLTVLKDLSYGEAIGDQIHKDVENAQAVVDGIESQIDAIHKKANEAAKRGAKASKEIEGQTGKTSAEIAAKAKEAERLMMATQATRAAFMLLPAAISGATDSSKSLNEVIINIGKLSIPSIVAALKPVIASLGVAKGAAGAFSAAMLIPAGVVGAVAVAAAGLAAIIKKIKENSRDAADAFEDMTVAAQELSNVEDEYNKIADSLELIKDRIKEIKKLQEGPLVAGEADELAKELEQLEIKKSLAEEEMIVQQFLLETAKEKAELAAIETAEAKIRSKYVTETDGFLMKGNAGRRGSKVTMAEELELSAIAYQDNTEAIKDYKNQLADLEKQTAVTAQEEEDLRQQKTQLVQAIREAEAAQNSARENMSKYLPQVRENIANLDEEDEAQKGLIDTQQKSVDLALEIMKTALGYYYDKVTDAVEDSTDALNEHGKKLSDLYNEVSEAVDAYDLFNQALKELNEEGRLSKSTYEKLIEVNEDFITIMGLEKDAAIDLITAHKDKQREITNALIKEQEQVIASAEAKIGATEAELLALDELLKRRQQLAYLDSREGLVFIEGGLQDSFGLIDTGWKTTINEARNKIATIEGWQRNLFSDKDDKTKTSKDKEQYKAVADAYAEINLELDKNNVLLQKNKTLQDQSGISAEHKIELIKEEIVLTEERQGLLHQYNEQMREEARQLQKELSGIFNFEGSWDDNSMIITNLEAIEGKGEDIDKKYKRILEIIKELPKASQDWWNEQLKNEKSAERMTQLEKDAVSERLANSKDWIEKRKFYDDWGADNEIAAWERVKAYIQDYYTQGIINHKEYSDYMFEIDKNLANARQQLIDERERVQREYLTYRTNQEIKDLERQKQAVQDNADRRIKAIETTISLLQERLDLINEEIDTINKLKDLSSYIIDEEIRQIEIQKNEIKTLYDLKISNIEDEIARLEERNDLLNEEQERQQKLLDIEEQKRRLTNISKERNVRIYQDGDWAWVADPKAVKDETDKLNDLQENYNKWEEDIAKKKEIEGLKNQINNLKEQLALEEKHYDDQIYNLQEFIKEHTRITHEFHGDEVGGLEDLINRVKLMESTSYSDRMFRLKPFLNEYLRITKESRLEQLQTDKTTTEALIKTNNERIQAIRDETQVLVDNYDRQIKNLNSFMSEYNDRNEEFYLTQIEELDELIEDIKDLEEDGFEDRLKQLLAFIKEYNKLIGNMDSPRTEDWSGMYMDARARGDWETMEYANRQANIGRGLGDVVTSGVDIDSVRNNSGTVSSTPYSSTKMLTPDGRTASVNNEYLDKYLKKGYTIKHKGGVVGDGGRDLPETVNKLFNLKPNEQIVKALKGELFIPEENIFKNFLPNMQNLLNVAMPNITLPKLPNVAGASGSGDTIYYIDELNVPTNDFQSFIKDFTSVVENHPNKTIMKVKKIGGLK